MPIVAHSRCCTVAASWNIEYGAPLIAGLYCSDSGTCIIGAIDLNCALHLSCCITAKGARPKAQEQAAHYLPAVTQETAANAYYLFSTIRIWLLAEWQRQCERLRVENPMWVACPIPALAADLGGLRSECCA